MVREKNGQFAKGNGGGPGRPPKAREERYKEILKGAVTYSQWRKIIKKLADKAERGDIQAAKLLFEYLVGKPTQELQIDSDNVIRVVYVDDWRNQAPDSA